MHVKTRRKELVDILCALGLSVSNDRVPDLANANVIKKMHGTVRPPNLRGQVFTTAVVDNIDHNPSYTTATGSFHGTSISLIQHPSTTEEGHDMGQIILPVNVLTVVSKSSKPTVSPVSESMMVCHQSTITDAISKEVEWLEDINEIYTAGKTKTEARNVNMSIVGDTRN